MNEKLILPNEFLSIAEEELREGKSVKILADGASMYPFIKGGKDYAEVVPMPSDMEPKLWQAYLFKYNGKYVIHRFVAKEGDIYRMLGDGNLKIEERVKRRDIIGILNRIHKANGETVDTTTKKWQRKGKIWNRMLPFRRYLLAIIRRMYRYGIIR